MLSEMTIKQLQKKIVEFRNKRDWKKFHNPKDLAISLVLESTEVLEHFQWKNQEEIAKYLKSEKITNFREELADVFWYLLLLCEETDSDLEKELIKKLRINEKRYIIEKMKGSAKKYTELKN